MRGLFIIVMLVIFLPRGMFCLELNQFPPFKGSSSYPYADIIEDVSPEITEVIWQPLKPGEDDVVTVSAKIFNNQKKTENIVISATLHYSTDEVKWDEILMEQDEKNKMIYLGKIPPQKEEDQVTFYISAQDNVGNTATEVVELRDMTSATLDKGWINITEDDNDKKDIISDNLDILSTYLTYDKEWIYLKMEVQDKITPGTTHNPPFLHTYGFGVLNPDIGDDILGGYLIFYAPHLKLGGYPEAALYSLGQLDFIYKAEATYEVKKNILTLKFRRSFLGNNPTNRLKIVGGSGGITDINLRRGASGGGMSVIEYLQNTALDLRGVSSVTSDMVDKFLKYITPTDATSHTTVYLRSHTYKVE